MKKKQTCYTMTCMKDYIEKAKRTDLENYGPEHLYMKGKERLLHAGIGIATESGEFLDALKKSIFYGKELDKVNLKEELGDLLWYIAIAMDELGTDFETEMRRNIEKLKTRYPKKFEQKRALERNLEKEREILEKE